MVDEPLNMDLVRRLPEWAQLAIAGASNRRAREAEIAARNALARSTSLMRCPLCGCTADLRERSADREFPEVICSSSHCRCRVSSSDALAAVRAWNVRTRELQV